LYRTGGYFVLPPDGRTLGLVWAEATFIFGAGAAALAAVGLLGMKRTDVVAMP